MPTLSRVFVFCVSRDDRELHRRLIEDPPRYSNEWTPPAGTELKWGDRIVFASTNAEGSPTGPGGWAAATIRFRVYCVLPFDAQSHPNGVPLVGGHDDFEATGAELGELAEELRLSAHHMTLRPLRVPAWLPFVLR